MFTTEARRIAQTELAAMTPELDSIDLDFERWEWTQAMTEYPAPRDDEDTLSVEEAEYYGII